MSIQVGCQNLQTIQDLLDFGFSISNVSENMDEDIGEIYANTICCLCGLDIETMLDETPDTEYIDNVFDYQITKYRGMSFQ